jgi:cysteine desulfurase / selenocysteine lyase
MSNGYAAPVSTLRRVRELFPALRRWAYLNAASSSPLATPVADAAVGHLRECERDGDVGFPPWLGVRERLRARVGRLIGAAPERVALTASTSMGFAAIAELFWRRGIREVLTLESEFPSTTVPFLARGFALRVVKARADGSYAVEDLEGGQAVALSAVQFASGFAIDLEGVAAHCRARNVPLAINGAQALGQVPIDVTALGADFLCGTSHKWLMGGYGVGLFFAKEGWFEELGAPWAGWLSVRDELRWQPFPSSAWEGSLARGASVATGPTALEAGGGPWPAYYALDAALSLIEGVGVQRIRAHNLSLQRQLRDGLGRLGFVPNAPLSSGICAVPVQGSLSAAVRALVERDVVVSPRAGHLRISTHAYNDESDVARALEAISACRLQPAADGQPS